MNARVVLLTLFLCANQIIGTVPAGAVPLNAPSRFKYAGGTVPAWKAGTEQPPENGTYSVTWKYPVFFDENESPRQKLNSWIRTVALTALFQGDDQLLQQATALTDTHVLEILGRDKKVREAAAEQAELVPTNVFGPYVLFTLYTEWIGAARPQHGIEHLVFDYGKGTSVPVQSLFKSNAKDVFSSLLRSAVEASFREKDPAYTACLQRKSLDAKVTCERELNDDDIEACANERSFDWHLLSIEGAQKVAITFPYAPGWRKTCGDEVYVLEGEPVQQLFVEPGNFRKGRIPDRVTP